MVSQRHSSSHITKGIAGIADSSWYTTAIRSNFGSYSAAYTSFRTGLDWSTKKGFSRFIKAEFATRSGFVPFSITVAMLATIAATICNTPATTATIAAFLSAIITHLAAGIVAIAFTMIAAIISIAHSSLFLPIQCNNLSNFHQF